MLDQLALACTAAGIVVGGAVLATAHQLRPALRSTLDFWLAAGLLRLTGDPTWQVLAGAAGIIVVRQVVGAGLQISGQTRMVAWVRDARASRPSR